MPTPVSVARQCLTAEAAHALDEAVGVARRRGHAQTTSLHAVSALLSLPTSSVLRDACARVRNSAYSPRLQFKALELCLGVSLDRIQSGQPAGGSDDPPVSNSLMAAIKRSQAHQRRLPENFRLYHEMSSQQQNQNTVSCVKVELRQLILSILDDPVVSRVFGEAGFRSSELKLSIIRPIPHVLRYPRPRGPPLFLCNMTENPDPGTGSGLYSVRRGVSFPYRSFGGFFHEDGSHRRIGAVFARERGRNPLLMGVSANVALIDFVHSLEKQIDRILPKELEGLNVINIANDISDQISDKFDKAYADTRFHELGKLVEQASGPGLVLNYGDLRAFTDSHVGDHGGLSGGSADYIVRGLSELLQRYGPRLWLIGAAASDEVYYKFVRRFPCVEKDWDLHVLTITSLRPCLAEKSYTKSSLMESFVPFGGFFSNPSELKLPFSGSAKFPAHSYLHKADQKKELTGLPSVRPGSSVCDQYQSSLPPWLQMTTGPDLNQGFGSTTKEGLDSVVGLKSPSSFSGSTGSAKSVVVGLKSPSSFSGPTGSAKSVTTDLGLGLCSVSARTDLKKHVHENPMIELRHDKDSSRSQSSSSSCQDHPSDFNTDSFKIVFRKLTERVSWQDEAARVISRTISQQQQVTTRRDVWFNLVGPDAMGKRRFAPAVAEIMHQSEKRFLAINLGGAPEMNSHDDLARFRGKTMVDYIFEGLYRNPLCVVFLENLEKADEQIRTSLSMAIQTGKFTDSHGREVSIGNTTFVTTLSSEHSGTIEPPFRYSEEKILRAKEREMEISIEISPCFPFARSLSNPSSMNKRRLIGWDNPQEKSETAEITKRCSWTTTGILDLNLPAEENETGDADGSDENSKLWLQNFTNHTRIVNVPLKPFDFDGLAERIEKGIKETLKKCVSSDCLLEIDPRIMERLLAAVYFSDTNEFFKDWMEKVLTRAFIEVRERFEITSSCAVKLVARDLDIAPDDQTQRNGFLTCKIVVS